MILCGIQDKLYTDWESYGYNEYVEARLIGISRYIQNYLEIVYKLTRVQLLINHCLIIINHIE